MKLFEIAKQPVDWNTKSEKQQIKHVSDNGYFIGAINNPSEAVQIAAVSTNAMAIQYIEHPTEQVQLLAISDHSCYYIGVIDIIQHPTNRVLYPQH